MTPDQLRALADGLDRAPGTTLGDREVKAAAAFLRDCADQKPVAWMHAEDLAVVARLGGATDCTVEGTDLGHLVPLFAGHVVQEDETERYKADYLAACKTIALMHEAATGRRGEAPWVGVVEDCAIARLGGAAPVAQPLTDIHSCSYFCTRPACVLAQRDALVARYVTPAQSLTWSNAPAKTVWGADMLVADVAIDADHTLTLYCERGQEGRVQAMFAAPVVAQQQVSPHMRQAC